MNNVLISIECVADLPKELYVGKDVSIIYYDIETEDGVFRDTEEISSENVMEYMIGGHKQVYSVIPTANDYKNFFTKYLDDYEDIVHICISSGISDAYENAKLARAKMGRDGSRVYVVDSKSLSNGQGLLVLEAIKARDEGKSAKEIVAHLEELIPRVITTFLANNADYLYYNKKVDKNVMTICRALNLHPVLEMRKGKLTVGKVFFGSYDKAGRKYIKYILSNPEKIKKEYGFLTYAGCSVDRIEKVKERVQEIIKFENFYECVASATVSCNCGPKTFAIMYIREE